MCERAQKAKVSTTELYPDGLLLAWGGVKLKASYTAADIINVNVLLCLIEDRRNAVQRQYDALRIAMRPDGENAEKLYEAYLRMEYNTALSRLIDGIDRFCGHDTDWPTFQPTSD